MFESLQNVITDKFTALFAAGSSTASVLTGKVTGALMLEWLGYATGVMGFLMVVLRIYYMHKQDKREERKFNSQLKETIEGIKYPVGGRRADDSVIGRDNN